MVLTNSALAPQGEIKNFGSFQFSRALSKLATCGFQVRLDNPLAQALTQAERYIKVYRSGVLVFCGPIISAEEVVERNTQTIALTCADAGWFLNKRLAGKTGVGVAFTSMTDRAQIAKLLIDGANAEVTTGVSTGTFSPHTSGSAITYKAGPFRPLLEIVQELSQALDGFDWRIHPTETWTNGGLIIGSQPGAIEMKTIIGTEKNNAVFEYGIGTRANVLSYTKTRTRDAQATRVFHAPSTDNVIMAEDQTASAQWGLLEDVVAADLNDTTMRNKLVQEHVKVRKQPRDLVKMTPHIDPGVTGRLPRPFADYDIGDIVTFRAVHNKTVRFAGKLRVYGITINVEQETGFERVTLTLEDES